MSKRIAFTLVELLVVISILAIMIGVLLPALNSSRRSSLQLRSNTYLRGIHQAGVVFGTGNNDNLPGLTKTNSIATGSTVSTGNGTTGASVHSRMWVLVNAQFITGELLVNPAEGLLKWSSGQSCTSLNNSYAALALSDSTNSTSAINHVGRNAEWKNNANSQAALFSDRVLDPANLTDNTVQSLWTGSQGAWHGGIVWGDSHVEWSKSHFGFITRYLSTITDSDNLFVSTTAAGLTDTAAIAGANAYIIYF